MNTTQIDFYILEHEPETQRPRFVCRLVEKAYQEKQRIFILCKDEAQRTQLDDLLWTFRDIAFIPHEKLNQQAPQAPIVLGLLPNWPYAIEMNYDLAIYLGETLFENFTAFKRFIEIIPNDEELKKQARLRFSHYRDQGCDLKTHKISTSS